MSAQLPARPNLDHLKKLAKSLLRAAQAGRPSALHRFAALPAFAGRPLESGESLALHDAQSVIAREHGFASWNALRDEVEARTMSFRAAVDEFVRCATGGASGRAVRILALHPGIKSTSLHTALVLGDVAGVERWLAERPALATEPGGPQQWEPLLYVCHTCLHRGGPARVDDLVAIARRLCLLGANPNAEYHWNWHPELPRTALWAAVCAVGHLPLAEALLEAGAAPTDGVTVHIAGGAGNIAALELLHRFGADLNGIAGGVPPLVYMMQWANSPSGPQWLLEHGADPNLTWGADGEAPLHVAARRWDLAMVEHLLQRGADPHQLRADGLTPHTLAELSGRHDIGSFLLGRGAADELSTLERFVACCARGDRAGADALLQRDSTLTKQLRPSHHRLLNDVAERGDAPVLETMLVRGFDATSTDKDQVTTLHRAAMAGRVDAARVLLAHGAPVNARDGMFDATPLVWAVEGWAHPQPGADHVGVARLLIAAGSTLVWTPPPGAPDPERSLEGLIEIQRAASRF